MDNLRKVKIVYKLEKRSLEAKIGDYLKSQTPNFDFTIVDSRVTLCCINIASNATTKQIIKCACRNYLSETLQ